MSGQVKRIMEKLSSNSGRKWNIFNLEKVRQLKRHNSRIKIKVRRGFGWTTTKDLGTRHSDLLILGKA